jgi:hypothetical protein
MTTTTAAIERLPVNEAFAVPADRAALGRAAEALKARGIEAHIVETAADAKNLVLSLIPDGAEVGQGASLTLDQAGITEGIEKSGKYNSIRARTQSMDRATQMNQIRGLMAAPEVQLNSVQALTEDGQALFASMSGSQLGPIASGAGKVILVVGAQKVVPDLATAFRRLDEYAFPNEDVRAQKAYGVHSRINKTLVLQGDFPGRVTVVLVNEVLGY